MAPDVDFGPGASPSEPTAPTPEDPGGLPASALVGSADLLDGTDRLNTAKSHSRRHLLWASLGFSPMALIPLLGLFMEGSLGLVATLSVLVVGVELWRYTKAKQEVRYLEEEVEDLRG